MAIGDPVSPGAETVGDDADATVVRLRAEPLDQAASESEVASEDAAGERDAVRPEPKARGRSGSSVADFVGGNARLLAAIALLAAGVIFVILGWYGTANTNILTEQIPYLISGGLLGVALIIVAGFLASSASVERQNRELREDLTRAISALGSGRPMADSGSIAVAPSDGQVYVVNGGRSYHIAGCPIVEGKESSALALDEAQRSGFTVCKLCGQD